MGAVKLLDNIVYQENMGDAGLLDLYLPEENSKDILLIYIHGGGLESGDKTDEKGIYMELAGNGITVVSPNYRVYPDAKNPEYVQDVAKAVAWSFKNVKDYVDFKHVFIGGISAGSYISMMLHFQPEFLKECGVDEKEISGYVFDAGQPTVHYNILKEHGMDPNAVRVDESAPIYYVEGDKIKDGKQTFLILVADNDIMGRREQNELLIKTLENHGYNKDLIDYRVIEGYEHVGYVRVLDEEGKYPYAKWLEEFIKNTLKK